MRVLVVDDDPALERAVEKLGHSSTVVTDHERAWERCKRDRYDVVLTASDEASLKLCRRIRDTDSHAVLIAVGPDGADDELAAAFAAGADDFLLAPVDPQELRVRLVAARRKRTLDQRLDEAVRSEQEVRSELARVARTDLLTGLGNRLRLDEDLAALHARAQRDGHPYAVAMVDVDHFKPFNDRYGHQAGDDVLRAVAAAMAGTCRAGDRAYRYGGEEIAVLYHWADLAAARRAAERLRLAVRDLAIPHRARPDDIGVVTVSVGVAAFHPDHAISAEDVLGAADAALYGAKRAGRDRVHGADPEEAEAAS